MKASDYFSKYFETIFQGLKSIDSAQLGQAVAMVWASHQTGKKIILVGNGGSAAMASHVAVDFTKAAGIRASCCHGLYSASIQQKDYCGWERRQCGHG